MRHWWNRPPAEIAETMEWATRELRALEQQRCRDELEAQRQAYRARRAAPCKPCGASGQVIVVTTAANGQCLGRTFPCRVCRPEDARRVLDEVLAAGVA